MSTQPINDPEWEDVNRFLVAHAVPFPGSSSPQPAATTAAVTVEHATQPSSVCDVAVQTLLEEQAMRTQAMHEDAIRALNESMDKEREQYTNHVFEIKGQVYDLEVDLADALQNGAKREQILRQKLDAQAYVHQADANKIGRLRAEIVARTASMAKDHSEKIAWMAHVHALRAKEFRAEKRAMRKKHKSAIAELERQLVGAAEELERIKEQHAHSTAQMLHEQCAKYAMVIKELDESHEDVMASASHLMNGLKEAHALEIRGLQRQRSMLDAALDQARSELSETTAAKTQLTRDLHACQEALKEHEKRTSELARANEKQKRDVRFRCMSILVIALAVHLFLFSVRRT